jgi:vancomycin permeability regulator SanA
MTLSRPFPPVSPLTHNKPARAHAVVRGAIGVLGGAVLLGGSLVMTAGVSVVTHFDDAGGLPAECAIVFGTAVRPVYDDDGNMVSANAGPGIDRRVSAATDLYHEGLVRKIFVSGGTGQGMRQSEALVMRRLALQQGVDPDHVIPEGESHSTEENLLLTRPLAEECGSIVAVSDRYHLARIAFLSRTMGWSMETYAAPRTATKAFEVRSSLREAIILSVLTVQFVLT